MHKARLPGIPADRADRMIHIKHAVSMFVLRRDSRGAGKELPAAAECDVPEAKFLLILFILSALYAHIVVGADKSDA